MVVTDSKDTLKGTLVLSNSDKDVIEQSKDTLRNTLTKSVQTETKNSKTNVQLTNVRKLSEDTLAIDYECQGVTDQKTAKEALTNAVQKDDVQKIIVGSTKKGTSNTADSKPQKTKESDQPPAPIKAPASINQGKPADIPAPKATKTSTKTLKSSKPSTIDCDNDLKITSQDDAGITGTLVAHSCHGTRFSRKSARVDNVATKLNSVLKDKCSKAGVKDNLNLKIPKVSGDKAKAEFTFHLPCEKSKQKTVLDQLRASCKDKQFIDTVTAENQPDDDDSSSGSDEEPTERKVSKEQPAPAPAPQPAPKPRTSGKTLKSSKPSTIDCDNDLKITSQDDAGITGTLVAHSCHGTRFSRKSARVDNVATKLNSVLKDKCSKAGVKDNLNLKIPKVSGDKAKAEFTFHLPCEKSKQKTVLDQLKASCKDKQFIDTVTAENQPDDDDSSSGSDEEPTERKVSKEQPAPAPAPQPAPKPRTSGKTLKSSKPSTFYCINMTIFIKIIDLV
ncbi:unnamed protein product [Rotaria sordida]|uniref:Uncharacterized protein n=1 Tax=Rotaria sordida TaxID=392033 RepID=A0A814TJQ6_9BILA|nr:unnamed protein product [Rotaria sordida]